MKRIIVRVAVNVLFQLSGWRVQVLVPNHQRLPATL